MIRLAICDDADDFLQQTKNLIDQWEGTCAATVTTELFQDGDALLAAHKKNPFDIILLDVVMPMLSGIDTARELREKDKSVKIVFLTSSAEYAVESYSVKASNYLLKPVSREKLFACMTELLAEIQSNAKSLVVKGVDATHRVQLADIEHLEAQLKHVIFFLRDGRQLESLNHFYTCENALLLEDGFFKCHRSYIVNIHHIKNYSHTEIIMRSGQRIPIARSCQKSFDEAYFRVVFGKVGDAL